MKSSEKNSDEIHVICNLIWHDKTQTHSTPYETFLKTLLEIALSLSLHTQSWTLHILCTLQHMISSLRGIFKPCLYALTIPSKTVLWGSSFGTRLTSCFCCRNYSNWVNFWNLTWPLHSPVDSLHVASNGAITSTKSSSWVFTTRWKCDRATNSNQKGLSFPYKSMWMLTYQPSQWNKWPSKTCLKFGSHNSYYLGQTHLYGFNDDENYTWNSLFSPVLVLM